MKLIWNKSGGIVCMFLLWCIGACQTLPVDVREALELAGKNRGELKKVLRHYGKDKQDSLKYQAACFLIGNMCWHSSGWHIDSIDPQLEWICEVADSAYYAIWQEMDGCIDSLDRCEEELLVRCKWLTDTVQKCHFQKSKVVKGPFPDLQVLDSEFLIEHIDNAFRQWNTSPVARRLTFDEFCEYILPYRPLRGYSTLFSGAELARRYEVFVNHDSTESVAQRVVRYNKRITAVRKLLGEYKAEHLGICNLSFSSHNCVDVAAFGCAILRACGLPVMVEYCDAYRDLPGRHYYCSLPDTTGEWLVFNPETRVPGDYKWRMGATMNVYRWYFKPQEETPYFLRRKGEYLPRVFSNPCCQDITADHFEVAQVRLPFMHPISGRLAWLAGFQSRRSLAPVTWGIVDIDKQEVCFEKVMFGRLYFPVYHDGQGLEPFGNPFYLEKDTSSSQGYQIHTISMDTTEVEDVLLTRKYSQKAFPVRVAREFVGAVFMGANRADFSDAQVIYKITEPPLPYFQDFVLPHPVKYQYYRLIPPKDNEYAEVGTVEYLTDWYYGDTNVRAPVTFAVLSPEHINDIATQERWVKLLDAPWAEMKLRAEADGNMQTSPVPYPRSITFSLPKPQTVCRIRFAPKNADNGIHRGDEYELFYWDREWKSVGFQVADYEFLQFSNVPKGALLWLRNYSRGQEEMPFLMKEGKQVFLYPDVMK